MDYLPHLRVDSEALLDAAAHGLEAAVPACPGWSVGDLVYHIGEVHHFWRTVVERGPTERPRSEDYPDAPRPVDGALLGWARDQADALLDTLADLDPDRPLWNWTNGPQVAGFVPRRMAQETAVHRVDAESAVGAHRPVDAGLAADGIDEYLSLFLTASGTYDGPEGDTLHLLATDVDRAWTVTMTGPLPPVSHGASGPPSLTVRGTASDVLLALWRRPATEVGTDGDAQVLERLLDFVDRD